LKGKQTRKPAIAQQQSILPPLKERLSKLINSKTQLSKSKWLLLLNQLMNSSLASLTLLQEGLMPIKLLGSRLG
jgi:hypothetical protein